MSITSIGIQSISGRTGTPLQPQPQPPANENERSEPADAPESEEAKQAPPPGMGKLVDVTV
ncbi:MAG: hypothetical protein PSV22_16675 [Pseudolabrys sp.]|nr:hypothetical protein [Pseudolabrys sp.]